jgi:hypothetical protein
MLASVALMLCAGALTGCTSSEDSALEATALTFAGHHLQTNRLDALRVKKGNECALVEVLAGDGSTHRVVLIDEGDPAAWHADFISRRFQWDDFVPDSEGLCGLFRAGAVRAPGEGQRDVVGGP